MKKILVTAGSTWTKIDEVRVMTNIFTGNTGIKIAKHFAKMGVETTLLYNPTTNHTDRTLPGLNVIPFLTFNNLKESMEREISTGNYDVVIHSAAVSDYGAETKQLIEVEDANLEGTGLRLFKEVTDTPGKIKSDLPELTLVMKKTEKIVDFVKDWDPNVYLVKFKLEVGRNYADLVDVAEKSRLASKADLIVANDLHSARNGVPPAIILGEEETKVVDKRKLLPQVLFNLIQYDLKRRSS